MPRPKNDGRGRLGGRAKGTPNKVTGERRALIAQFVERNWDDFLDSYSRLDDPKEKCNIFLQMMPYYAPKLAAVEYKDNTPRKTLQEELDELCKLGGNDAR